MKQNLKKHSENIENAIGEINISIKNFMKKENSKKAKGIKLIREKYKNKAKERLEILIVNICKTYKVNSDNVKQIAQFDIEDYAKI